MPWLSLPGCPCSSLFLAICFSSLVARAHSQSPSPIIVATLLILLLPPHFSLPLTWSFAWLRIRRCWCRPLIVACCPTFGHLHSCLILSISLPRRGSGLGLWGFLGLAQMGCRRKSRQPPQVLFSFPFFCFVQDLAYLTS